MQHKKYTPRKAIKFAFLVSIVVGLIIFFAIATDTTLRTTHYELNSDKIKAPTRFAVLTDLHAADYGENQAQIINVLLAENPMAVFFVGDIFDERFDTANAVSALSQSAKLFPTFYVTGNHEYKKHKGKPQRSREFKKLAGESGATVLQGECVSLQYAADSGNNCAENIKICGIDDPLFIGKTAMIFQLQKAIDSAQKTEIMLEKTHADTETGTERDADAQSNFTILLAHRPELLDTYSQFGFDLVVSGHAHGGQWRIPGLIEGVYASSQGLFPKYTSGKYFSGTTTLILSRGLGKTATFVPRIFNPVEIVIIDVLPTE